MSSFLQQYIIPGSGKLGYHFATNPAEQPCPSAQYTYSNEKYNSASADPTSLACKPSYLAVVSDVSEYYKADTVIPSNMPTVPFVVADENTAEAIPPSELNALEKVTAIQEGNSKVYATTSAYNIVKAINPTM